MIAITVFGEWVNFLLNGYITFHRKTFAYIWQRFNITYQTQEAIKNKIRKALKNQLLIRLPIMCFRFSFIFCRVLFCASVISSLVIHSRFCNHSILPFISKWSITTSLIAADVLPYKYKSTDMNVFRVEFVMPHLTHNYSILQHNYNFKNFYKL